MDEDGATEAAHSTSSGRSGSTRTHPVNMENASPSLLASSTPVPAPRTMSSSTTRALAVVCAAAAVVSAFAATAVIRSALRGGVAAGLLAAVVTAPSVLLALLLSVVGAAWLYPAVLAAVVQVVAVEVIRLSCAMAAEEELDNGIGREDEQGGREDGELEGRGARLGRSWAEGRLRTRQHQTMQREPSHPQRERKRRRVIVEWEAGQMFLEIRRAVASEWLVSLVNRYMHGPIPMKIEICKADSVRVCLSPAQLLRLGSFQSKIVGLKAFGRRTHEDEWDEGFYYEKAIKFRQWAADYVQALVEGTYGRKMKSWGGIIDSIINNINFDITDLHLRVDDRWEGHSFGLLVDSFSCTPGAKEPESLGATPHEFAVTGVLFYVDPHNEIARSPECPALTIKEGTFRVEFPDIFRTLILNREVMPGGRGKRLRVRGKFSNMVVNVQANQMRTYLFSLLGTFCPYKYSAWKATIREQAAADCKPYTPSQRLEYLEVFGTLREERGLTSLKKRERMAKLDELERHMSYRDILVLRKEARGWRLEDMGEEPPANPPMDPDFMRGLSPDDPQYEELARYSARIQGLQLSAWEKSTYLREIMVESVTVHNLEARLSMKADPERDGPENKAFVTPVQTVAWGSELEGRFRMFLSRTKASNRLHSRGANGIDGEPALPWLMAGGFIRHPVVLDEATASRLGYVSTCIVSPANVRVLVQSSRVGGGSVAELGGKKEAAVNEAGVDGDRVPEAGGTFRMWSDYLMAIEGHAHYVQAGTLLPPILDVAWTVADSFRRRWASGGQYPERKLARVRLAERRASNVTSQDLTGGNGSGSNLENAEDQDSRGEAGDSEMSIDPEMPKVKLGKASRFTIRRRRERAIGEEGAARGVGAGEGDVDPEQDGDEDEDGGGEYDEDEDDDSGSQAALSPRGRHSGVPPRGFSQVLSRLDGLDSGALVEEALEDLNDEERRLTLTSTGSVENAVTRRRSRGASSHSDREREADNVQEVAVAALEMVAPTDPLTLSASMVASAREDISMVAVPEGGDNVAGAAMMVDEEVAAVAEVAASQQQMAEKFMLPTWHYLFLSGRSISMDFRWTNVDLLLMQDPIVEQDRDSGKNVLALRSSGSLSMRSSIAGESVDASLDSASLLPCFYDTRENDANNPWWRKPHGDAEDAAPWPRERVYPWRQGEPVFGEASEGDHRRRLAELLGGGHRAEAAVARTWLGQRLVTVDSRPLLEPFSLQFAYGTVIAETAQEGHGTGVTVADACAGPAQRGVGKGQAEGFQSVDDDDNEAEGQLGPRRASKRDRGEMVAGVFRVAVSELQLLVAQSKLKRPATIEVEVDGQTRSFPATAVTSTTEGDSVELEFVCRCRLQRRRGRAGPLNQGGDPEAGSDELGVGLGTGGNAAVGTTEDGIQEEDDNSIEAEPEAAATVRLRAEEGTVLGEAWAELPGAPEDWARYPLYAPGAQAPRNEASGVAVNEGTETIAQSTSGLDQSGIPAPPGALRRRWGWGVSHLSSSASVAAMVRYRPWFRTRSQRPIAGEVKLRLGWVPSGLAVIVHRWRRIKTGTENGDATDGEADSPASNLEERRESQGGVQRRLVVVHAEPGGGSADAYPVVFLGEEMKTEEEAQRDCDASVANGADGSVNDSINGGVYDGEGQLRTSKMARASVTHSPGNFMPSSDGIDDDRTEKCFFFLDPACLLGEVETSRFIRGRNDAAYTGGGARLVLSAGDNSSDGNGVASAGAQADETGGASSGVCRAEVLLIPGADPGRRWVSLADSFGTPVEEVDISLGWAVAPPSPLPNQYTGHLDSAAPPSDTCASAHDDDTSIGAELATGQTLQGASMAGSVTVAAAAGASVEVPSTGNVAKSGAGDESGVGKAEMTGADSDKEEGEGFPEPSQVVARCFNLQATDLVLRVSDLDVAVLATMAKGIVRVFKPPKSQEEKELELEAVQQRLLEEANSKRNAAIQQLRAAFQNSPSEASSSTSGEAPGNGTGRSGCGADQEEFLNVQDVVGLLRDFLRAKALTESEIRREAEEFMLVVLAVADAAKGRMPLKGRSRSESPTRRRHSGGGSGDASRLREGFFRRSRGGDGSRVSRKGEAGKKQWLTRLRPEWWGEKEKPIHAMEEGFICPQCKKKMTSPAALLAHFHVFHGGGGGGGDGVGGYGSDVGVEGERSGGSDMPGGDGEMNDGEMSLSRGRHSWRGGSISLDHFILALQSFMEEQLHEGYVMARCEEFASEEIKQVILAGYPTLAHRLASISPIDSLREFWNTMKTEVGVTRNSGGGQQVRVLQTRMVRALKNYAIARSTWSHVVVPALWRVPRCGLIKAFSGRVYLPMPTPVREGQQYFVDKQAMVITRLPPELAGGRDRVEIGGTEAGSGGGTLLSGIMTHSKDRGFSGVPAFLTFTLDRPAMVYVCYDQRLKRLPVWLRYFEKTGWIVGTTEGLFGVWRKRYAKGQVRLGCNEGWRKGCSNYFLLIGPDSPPQQSVLSSGERQQSGKFTAPAGVLPDADAEESDVVSPRWVLRPHMVAGGKGSLAQAVRALVDERRKSRAMARSQLLPGGESRVQLDAAASTAAELGLELAPVEFHYSASFDFGKVSLRIVDPAAAETTLHVKAEVRLTHASGILRLRHLHPGDWLGRPDSLMLKTSVGGGGTYHNPLVDEREHCIEPWSAIMECHSDRGKPTTQFRVEMPEHLVLNVTSALVDNIKTIATLVARNWTGRYTEPSVGPLYDAGAGGSLVIHNSLGIGVVIQGADDTVGPDRWCTSSDEGFEQVSNSSSGSEHEGAEQVLRNIALPTTVPPGQAVACSFMAARASFNSPANAKLVVYVPGFETVSGVNVGCRGSRAYPLIESGPGVGCAVASDSGSLSGGKGSAERATSIRTVFAKKGLALVVEVREESSSGRQTKDLATSMVVGGLVAELRTNVRLHNASASDVEVDIGVASSSVAVNSQAARGARSSRVRDGWVRGAGGAPIVKLAPSERLALPLSVLSSWQLRLVGDGTDTRHRPLRLSPALLDPAVPDALRLTGDMERNSLCLKMAKGGVMAATAGTQGEPYVLGPAALSPKGRKTYRAPTFQRPPSPEMDESTASAAGSSRSTKVSPPSSPASRGLRSNAADWVLTVQPSYLINNALPCALEVEVLQPVEAGAGGGTSRNDSYRVRNFDSGDASETSSKVDDRDAWNDSNSDTSSATSSTTTTTTGTRHGGKRKVGKATVRNPALDLFFLPTSVGSEDNERLGGNASARGEARTGPRGADRSSAGRGDLHSLWLDAQRDGPDSSGGFESAWRGTVDSGKEAKVGRVDNSRPFYVRVRLSDPAHGSSQGSSSYSQPPCCQWSDLLIITVYEHAHRSSFNSRQPEDVTWRSAAREDWGRMGVSAAAASGSMAQKLRQDGRTRRQQHPELKAVRTWGRSLARRLTFYAPYWIVNKTGLALNYRARFPHKTFKILSDSPGRMRGRDMMGGGGVDHADGGGNSSGQERRPSLMPGDKLDGKFEEQQHGNRHRGHVSSAEEAAVAQISRLLLQDAKYLSDEENLAFFGGRSVPVMLACPAQTLEVMPYARAGWAEDAGLCVCDLQVDSDSASLYYCSGNLGPGSRLYTDCAVSVEQFPAHIAEAAACPRSAVQILTPWREPPAPEREAFMTFWVTRDAHVHICMDSRTPPNKLPSWLEYAGFRKQPDTVLTTSEPGLTLEVYRRFFRARTLVRLGGSDNGRDLATALTDFSGASVTPDGPAPKSMLANYTVLLTMLQAPSTEAPSSPFTLRGLWSESFSRSSEDVVAPVPVPEVAAQFEEADVRDAIVDRDVGESIMCRRRYRILPDFASGDRPYVDRDYTIPTLPAELQGLRLTCLQTAQGDKRAGGSRLWRFSLMQDSIVLVVFDGRATLAPTWLETSGFTLWEGVEIAGAEYRIPYVYKVYRKRCSTGLVWLGGNGAKGCKGAKRGYFVLVYVADRLAEAPLPQGAPPLGQHGNFNSENRTQLVGKEYRGRHSRHGSFSTRARGSSGASESIGDGSEMGGIDGGNDGESIASVPGSPNGCLASLERPGRSRSLNASQRFPRDATEKPANRRRYRSMSSTAVETTLRAALMPKPPCGGRTRSWTGGEAELLRAGGRSAQGRQGRSGIPGFRDRRATLSARTPDEAPEGLQRLSEIWDKEKNGPLSQIPIVFDRAGRRWSRTFNVDAANTAGPLETSGATLGVSVSALTGQFHRTRVVTLYPRFIVRNFLGIPLEVMPTIMSPKVTAVTRLSRCLPPFAPLQRNQYPRSNTRHGATPANSHAAAQSVEHLVQAVPTSAAVIVYGFNSADQLVKGLSAAERVADSANSGDRSGGGSSGGSGSGLGVIGEPDDQRNCVLMRAAIPIDTDDSDLWARTEAGAGEASGHGNVGDGFGPAMANGLSRPVLADEMGETHLWVADSNGRRHLAAAFVSLQRATVFITLSPSAQFPPFRVENRSSTETLAYRQEDADRTMGWHILPPLTWHAFLWQEPHKPRAIEVAFAGALATSSGGARHSEVYSFDKVGEREPLAEQEASITRSVLTLVATGTQVKTLASEVRVEGRTRVLSFGDARLADGQGHGAYADSVTRLKRLYTQLDVGVRLAGLSFNMVACSSEGPAEVMSVHVDSVTVAKRSGGNCVEVQVFHMQVDDMRRRTRMPVVLQPADSGFNSHLRRSSSGESSGRIGDALTGAPGSGTPVPFLRVLYEREVATMSMPHLKSLDIELQEIHTHVDLDFILHLLGLAGAVLPELTSEEILAKMCRTKARGAVRHTVPTPAKRDLSMVYLEAFRHSTIVVRLELFVGQGALSPDAAALEDPEDTSGGLTVLGGGFLTVVSVVGSSIAHVNPTFVFDELVVTHYCGGLRGLIALVVTALANQAVAQGYKVVGSMELLGDPLSLMSKLGDSVVQFFSKTRAEMTGSADTMGAGAKVLMKGLVGGTFGSAAKITGSLEGMIRGLSGTAIMEEGGDFEYGEGNEGGGEVKDLEHGVKQGGKVFYESMKVGISGLRDRPMEGAKEEGLAGFIAGMAKGIVGAVAAPVAGALGAVARVTEGVDASTRLSDEKRMSRRRAARTVVSSSLTISHSRALAPLTPTDLLKHIPRRFATLWAGTAGAGGASAGSGGDRSQTILSSKTEKEGGGRRDEDLGVPTGGGIIHEGKGKG